MPLLLVYSQFNRMNYDEHKRMNDSGNKASQNMIDCWQFNNAWMIFGKHSIWITKKNAPPLFWCYKRPGFQFEYVQINGMFGFFFNFLVVFLERKKQLIQNLNKSYGNFRTSFFRFERIGIGQIYEVFGHQMSLLVAEHSYNNSQTTTFSSILIKFCHCFQFQNATSLKSLVWSISMWSF